VSYNMRSFCVACGRYRQTMPFGEESRFFDRYVCDKCSEPGPGIQLIAKYKFFRGWFDRNGNKINILDPTPKGDQ